VYWKDVAECFVVLVLELDDVVLILRLRYYAEYLNLLFKILLSSWKLDFVKRTNPTSRCRDKLCCRHRADFICDAANFYVR